MSTRNKIILTILIVGLIMTPPIYICTSSTLSIPRSYADDNPRGFMAEWTLYKIAWTHMIFKRYKPAALAFHQFYSRYPESDSAEAARYREAKSWEEEDPGISLYLYDKYLEDYPDGEHADEAEAGKKRIKTWNEELDEEDAWSRYDGVELYDDEQDEEETTDHKENKENTEDDTE